VRVLSNGGVSVGWRVERFWREKLTRGSLLTSEVFLRFIAQKGERGSEKDESEMKRKGDRERRKSTRQIEEREWEE